MNCSNFNFPETLTTTLTSIRGKHINQGCMFLLHLLVILLCIQCCQARYQIVQLEAYDTNPFP